MPPVTQNHIDANKELASLAQKTGANFISVKALSDASTKRILPTLIQNDLLHYNNEGIKAIARQIKRSLYSNANLITNPNDPMRT